MNRPADGGSPGPQVHLGHLALVYVVFGVVSLLTALVYGGASGTPLVGTTRSGTMVPAEVRFGETVGPVNVPEAGTTIEVAVSKALPDRSWAFVEVEVLDAAKTRLLSLGDQVWRESGVDDEGAWSENVTQYTGHIVLEQPGNYHFRVVGETGSTAVDDKVRLLVVPAGGSTILFWVAGITALGIAFALHIHHKRSVNRRILAARMDRTSPWTSRRTDP